MLLFGVLVLGSVAMLSLRGVAGFYTDYLWFDQLGYGNVFTSVLGAQIVLVVLFTLLFFVLCFANLTVADRLAPVVRPPGPEEEVLSRYHLVVGRRAWLVRLVISVLLALLAGFGVAGRWQEWLLFTNGGDFGIEDAQFGRDVGFYVFKLPFSSFVVGWLFGALIVTLVVTTILHYVNGGIRLQAPGERVRPAVKAHLSVLLGLLALVKAADYWLARFELTTSTRGAVDGATYTDVKAQLPATNLLILISLFAVLLLIVNIRRRGWVLPTLAVGLWAFVALVMGNIYPAVIQSLRVEPAESEKEAEYIGRNIDATRSAFGLDGVVEVQIEGMDNTITATDLRENPGTVRNIRTLDPLVVQGTFDRLQGEREFYRFSRELDSDRYMVDGEPTQVMIGARELEPNVTRSWESQHVAFTHGYGVALAPVSRVRATGDPEFLIGDLPIDIDPSLDVVLDRPQLYVGEGLGGYAVVGASRDEVDFTDENQETLEVRYADIGGEGGVEMGSMLRKVAFALRFGQLEPLISNFVTDDSRVIYVRDVRKRVEKLAPFLEFDADPYPVLHEGRVVYVIDGYTTTSRYPYAQRAPVGELPSDSGLRTRFNYVRNSVKAVVDAYDGSVKLYQWDTQDPVLKTWMKVFPGVVEPRSQIDQSLLEHLRYPVDLFKVQRNVLERYHVTDAQTFYEDGERWRVPEDPATPSGQPKSLQPPYFLTTARPGQEDPAFSLTSVYLPNSRQNLAAFMSVNSEASSEDYGKMQILQLPSDTQVPGPSQIANQFSSDRGVTQALLQFRQSDARVLNGNLLTLPVGDALLYVQPVYIRRTAEEGSYPVLQFVAASFGEEVGFGQTLDEALRVALGLAEGSVPDPDEESSGGDTGGSGDGGAKTTQEYLRDASAAYSAAQKALEAGDLAEYQRRINQMNAAVENAQDALGQSDQSGGE
jgi:uncharacterized membrane protein (UPF0182 family)